MSSVHDLEDEPLPGHDESQAEATMTAMSDSAKANILCMMPPEALAACLMTMSHEERMRSSPP